MRTITCLLILAISPFYGVAQKVTPQVTNQAGFDLSALSASGLIVTVSIGEPAIATFINANYMLTQGFDLSALSASSLIVTVSIGEPAIATFINANYMLTQGFLQPEIVPCGEYELTYYPNPTRDDMTVQALGCDTEIEVMQLIDVWGRVITTIKPTSDNIVKLGDISPGVYFIRVFLTNSESETLKIAKVSN